MSIGTQNPRSPGPAGGSAQMEIYCRESKEKRIIKKETVDLKSNLAAGVLQGGGGKEV